MLAKLLPGICVLVVVYSSCIFRHFQVAASGVFEIRVEEFVNERGREQKGNCCEGTAPEDFERCSAPCNTAFRVCFSHFQSNLGPDTECTFGSAKTPVLGGNIISSRSEFPDSNLVRLNFNFTWTRGFSLVIEATHQRGGQSSEKLIARMEKKGSIDSNTDWKTETQTQQEKILRYSYRVRCDQHYYGDGCSEYCRPRDDMFGHWTCDRSGEKVCLDGWISSKGRAKAYCLEPICLPGCHSDHGKCKRPNECLCSRGWTGELCNECRTYPGCLHGTCHNSFECICDSGWGGMLCNHDLQYCTNHKPCKNGARCTNVGHGSFSCECPAGFTGRECEVKMNECDPNPCKNGATCMVQEVGYICECPENFFGPNCENTYVSCAMNPCRNGGKCLEDKTGYQCKCQPGFRGTNCVIEETRCPLSACLNGGTCHRSLLKFTCSCPLGFSGNTCQNKIAKCELYTCKNGGKCSSISDGLRCNCKEGFSGPHCEHLEDPCEIGPCQNGGKCVVQHDRYRCICTPRFAGYTCERRSKCFVNPCKNGGKCVDEPTHLCRCTLGYHGQKCEQVLPAAGSLQASFSDDINTKIIVLAKSEKSGLNTAQWITVCFASAFLLLIFAAVAICIAYHRYGKSTYTGGRAVKSVSLRRNLVRGIGSGERDSDRSSAPLYRATSSKGGFFRRETGQETETAELADAPTQSLSPSIKFYYASRSSEVLDPGEEKPDYRENRAPVSWKHKRLSLANYHCDLGSSKTRLSSPYEASHAAHRSMSLNRLKNEESSNLPTYQEACSGRHFTSEVV